MSAVTPLLADPVTRHMRTDLARIRSDRTVGQALEHIRLHEVGGRVVYFYVVDADDRLVGVVPTRRLLRAALSAPVTEVMIAPVVAVPHTASVLVACEFFALHKLLAFPVVDADQKLLGLVDVDLYTDELADLEQRREGDDLFQLGGVHLTEAEQRQPLLAFRRRFPWLLCNVVGGLLAAVLSDAYEDVATLVLVTPFIALVTALAEGWPSSRSAWPSRPCTGGRPPGVPLGVKLLREVQAGLLLGTASGLRVGVLAFAWKGSWRAGASLCLGIGGGVMASAAADMFTLLLHFNLGRWFLVRPAGGPASTFVDGGPGRRTLTVPGDHRRCRPPAPISDCPQP